MVGDQLCLSVDHPDRSFGTTLHANAAAVATSSVNPNDDSFNFFHDDPPYLMAADKATAHFHNANHRTTAAGHDDGEDGGCF
jgi:NAD-specific glutamate dehydrogenase